jgi:hypothetical protein
MTTTYLDNHAFFLKSFKELSSADQAKFNEELQKLKLGDPLIPNSPFAEKSFFDTRFGDIVQERQSLF